MRSGDQPTTAACRCGHERADHSPAREDDFGCRKCACNGFAPAASIPYEGTDCTADEAVEAVKAVRATAAYDAAAEVVRRAVRAGSSFYGELTLDDAAKGVIALTMWLAEHPTRPECYHSVSRDDCRACGYRHALLLLQTREAEGD